MSSQSWTDSEKARLQPRNQRVLDALLNADWMTLEQIAAVVGMRNGSTCASRLRDIKATGLYDYERVATETPGVWSYRLFAVTGNPQQLELYDAATA